MAYITQTSEDILKYLKERKFKLSTEDKDFIIKKVYDAISCAYQEKSNGCDCGQMNCIYCHG